MEITAEGRAIGCCRREGRGIPPTAKKWAMLASWLLAIWMFVFVLAPWLQQQTPALQTLAGFIRETGIDASALYYTEVAETAEAELVLRQTFEYGQFE